jgi:DNA repair exonuclease SbcCD ATPase subunit
VRDSEQKLRKREQDIHRRRKELGDKADAVEEMEQKLDAKEKALNERHQWLSRQQKTLEEEEEALRAKRQGLVNYQAGMTESVALKEKFLPKPASGPLLAASSYSSGFEEALNDRVEETEESIGGETAQTAGRRVMAKEACAFTALQGLTLVLIKEEPRPSISSKETACHPACG